MSGPSTTTSGSSRRRNSPATSSNSLVATVVSVILALIAGSLGAYAIARFHLKYRLERKIGLSLLTLRIVPPVVILIPVYLLMLSLKLLDTWLGLIITYTAFNITFCVWMMESFFREIPVDLEEAAMVDGDTRFNAFRRIALPLAAPGLARPRSSPSSSPSTNFLFALALTATPSAMTMPRGTATLIGRIDTDWASMSAADVLGALPIVVFALLVQRPPGARPDHGRRQVADRSPREIAASIDRSAGSHGNFHPPMMEWVREAGTRTCGRCFWLRSSALASGCSTPIASRLLDVRKWSSFRPAPSSWVPRQRARPG